MFQCKNEAKLDKLTDTVASETQAALAALRSSLYQTQDAQMAKEKSSD